METPAVRLAPAHRFRGLGRDVARRGPGAPGGHHQAAALLVAQLPERGLDQRLLVRDNAAHGLPPAKQGGMAGAEGGWVERAGGCGGSKQEPAGVQVQN